MEDSGENVKQILYIQKNSSIGEFFVYKKEGEVTSAVGWARRLSWAFGIVLHDPDRDRLVNTLVRCTQPRGVNPAVIAAAEVMLDLNLLHFRSRREAFQDCTSLSVEASEDDGEAIRVRDFAPNEISHIVLLRRERYEFITENYHYCQ
ncbi:MAG: hypothetical protein UV82_C0017G0010 [Candidatus Magasanikbacteria bacterium GW2011_GWD2_43_18]|uniref:Uncharacterized protein n=1 Tax=Candidatus Magasanikbacteria bacterium GW2011_GWE2_42_7 TaxID=1619052 RepID=A0A0G1DIN8_9BACT|nr:MAG: hypothetical protein UV18_C0013G0010 [Candidatus Magasanikbacteria bacterium GW2011_GWC2_42_27]KKS70676.1 MAG: hypothetical protein UV42_C0047G0005 [Candidatus Magasanikbacteria bacterium GW2011_GWE2_42_7]KKT03390.1 MAG: hypothetical protein UV82_C0017G0010 [Candidatus Magasanikbacteria bacterium GW2011_GWD2_43_18]KKT25270.1 MAG: hypothetical protein UW10_C0010G0015 [Candidatus Magasanikbacteria bacterium GW2011_GWA2_43_9]HBB38582.1 hypothetical protein [Candidatus Magasanikbacteria bac